MNLIDTVAVSHILKKGIALNEQYYLSPEVTDEVDLTRAMFNKKLPEKIFEIKEHPIFNEGTYLRRFQEMINKHSDCSFFNMTGFGDISILATLHMLQEQYNNGSINYVDNQPVIKLFTNDNPLTKKVVNEFQKNFVSVIQVNGLV